MREDPLTFMGRLDELLDGCPVDVALVEPIIAVMRSGMYLLAAIDHFR